MRVPSTAEKWRTTRSGYFTSSIRHSVAPMKTRFRSDSRRRAPEIAPRPRDQPWPGLLRDERGGRRGRRARCTSSHHGRLVSASASPTVLRRLVPQDFLQGVTRRLAAGAVRRRQVGSVVHVAHEIDSSARSITVRGREQLPCRSERRGNARGRSDQPCEGDNPTDMTRRSNIAAIDGSSAARKYR